MNDDDAPPSEDALRTRLAGLKQELNLIDRAVDASDLSPKLERLKAIFPSGVCDYSRPGVGQQVTKTTWLRYEDKSQLAGIGHE